MFIDQERAPELRHLRGAVASKLLLFSVSASELTKKRNMRFSLKPRSQRTWTKGGLVMRQILEAQQAWGWAWDVWLEPVTSPLWVCCLIYGPDIMSTFRVLWELNVRIKWVAHNLSSGSTIIHLGYNDNYNCSYYLNMESATFLVDMSLRRRFHFGKTLPTDFTFFLGCL